MFNFFSGLQPWAQMEHWRQGVKDLLGVTASAEALVDYKLNKGGEESRNKSKDKRSKDKKERVGHRKKSKKKFEKAKDKANFSKPKKDPRTYGCFFSDNLAKNCSS